MPKIKTKTNSLTKYTLRILDLSGFYVWRQNNGGVYDPIKQVFRRNSSTPGISDILGFDKKTGKIIAVEIKTGKDVLSPYQERFLNDVSKAGGYSFVVNTFEDADIICKLFRKPPLTESVNKPKV